MFLQGYGDLSRSESCFRALPIPDRGGLHQGCMQDSLGLSDPSRFVDLCLSGTGLVRVCNLGDALYTQTISAISGTFPNWSALVKVLSGQPAGVDIPT